MDLCDRFKKIRVSLNLTQSEMSSRVGLSRNAWQAYELGKSFPGTDVYLALINMGFSVDWVLSGTGKMDACWECLDLSEYCFLPLYVSLSDIGRSHSDDCILDWLAFKREWVRLALRSTPENLSLIIAEGDSMLPTIRPGDTLVVDHSKTVISGDGVYVLSLAHSCLVKRVQVLIDGSVVVLSDNPAYSPQTINPAQRDGIVVGGRIIWHGKRV